MYKNINFFIIYILNRKGTEQGLYFCLRPAILINWEIPAPTEAENRKAEKG